MSLSCQYEGCTVDETERCALENVPSTCPHRINIGAAVDESITSDSDEIGLPVLDAPIQYPSFPLSSTLGINDVEQLMAQRYVSIVGILGDPESGKTACLASIYLLVSNGALKGWSYADSKSLMGFESIARGARDWNLGSPPEQMTVHTEMSDDRQPGFLHLRLKRLADGQRVDFALPDLPGEWTKTLVRTARSDRFEFLKSAEVLWLMIDGKALRDRERTQGCITHLGQLVGRLVEMMGTEALPRLLVVITHLDAGPPSAGIISRIHNELSKHGGHAEVISVASFADPNSQTGVKPGEGIEGLLNATVPSLTPAASFWPRRAIPEGASSYLGFRSEWDD